MRLNQSVDISSSLRPQLGNDLGALKHIDNLSPTPMRVNQLPKLSHTQASPRGLNSGRQGSDYNSPRRMIPEDNGSNNASPRSPLQAVKTRNTSLNVRSEARNIANSMALPQGSWKVSV